MRAEQREILQTAILRVLNANHTRFGLPVSAITLHVGASAFPRIESEAVQTELDYLQSKGLAETTNKTLEPANQAWKRTAAGRDYLSERGLE